MSDTKKSRAMTLNGFLHKSNQKAANAAAGFLAAHREFLTTGELAQVTSPILVKMDAGELMPTPALEQIKEAVLAHKFAVDKAKGEEAMAKADAPAPTKKYTVTIYNAKGEVCTRVNAKGEIEDLIANFGMGQDAEGWADRRLVEGPPDCYGVMTANEMVSPITGEVLSSTILRVDAIARRGKVKAGPVMKSKPQSTSRLSFGVKVGGTTPAKFSRG